MKNWFTSKTDIFSVEFDNGSRFRIWIYNYALVLFYGFLLYKWYERKR